MLEGSCLGGCARRATDTHTHSSMAFSIQLHQLESTHESGHHPCSSCRANASSGAGFASRTATRVSQGGCTSSVNKQPARSGAIASRQDLWGSHRLTCMHACMHVYLFIRTFTWNLLVYVRMHVYMWRPFVCACTCEVMYVCWLCILYARLGSTGYSRSTEALAAR